MVSVHNRRVMYTSGSGTARSNRRNEPLSLIGETSGRSCWYRSRRGLPRRLGARLVAMTGGDGGAGLGGQGWQWDVVLSFAGAQRDYVGQVAAALKAQGIRCFYDADEQIDLWGKYLPEELPAIYGERAGAVVVFISAEYAARDWTRLERRAPLDPAGRARRAGGVAPPAAAPPPPPPP